MYYTEVFTMCFIFKGIRSEFVLVYMTKKTNVGIILCAYP